ncbi:MAG: hypothetical protein AAFP26_11030, partial [Planctomycetota bacterium]
MFRFERDRQSAMSRLAEGDFDVHQRRISSIWSEVFGLDARLDRTPLVREVRDTIDEVCSLWRDVFNFDRALRSEMERLSVGFDASFVGVSSVWREVFRYDGRERCDDPAIRDRLERGFATSVARMSDIWRDAFKLGRMAAVTHADYLIPDDDSIQQTRLDRDPLLKHFMPTMTWIESPPEKKPSPQHPLRSYFEPISHPHARKSLWPGHRAKRASREDTRHPLVSYFLQYSEVDHGRRSVALNHMLPLGVSRWPSLVSDTFMPKVSLRRDYDEHGRAKLRRGMSEEQRVEVRRGLTELRERESELSKRAYRLQHRLRGRLSTAIEVMKRRKGEMSAEAETRANEEVREIKADYEVLEKRLKMIAASVKVREDEEASFEDRMYAVRIAGDAVEERERSMKDATRFGDDLEDAVDDVEEAMARDCDQNNEYRKVIADLELQIEQRQQAEGKKRGEVERVVEETLKKLASMRNELRELDAGTPEARALEQEADQLK